MKYPIITYKQMCKLLKRNGYKLDRFNGDHAIYVKNGCNHVSVSFKLNPMVARRLIIIKKKDSITFVFPKENFDVYDWLAFMKNYLFENNNELYKKEWIVK